MGLSNLYDKNRKPLGKTHKIEQLCHDRLLLLTVTERWNIYNIEFATK